MKRLFAALLFVAMLCQALPTEAFAAVGHVLTEEELARAYALTGLGRDEAVYHNGMKPNASWNAAEISDWIEERLELEVHSVGDTLSRASYALGEMENDDPEAFRRFVESGAYDKVRGLYAEVERLREEMRYYNTKLTECSGLIAETKRAMESEGDSLYHSEKVRYSARIEQAVTELTEARQYVADHLDRWERRIREFQDYLEMGRPGRRTAPTSANTWRRCSAAARSIQRTRWRRSSPPPPPARRGCRRVWACRRATAWTPMSP